MNKQELVDFAAAETDVSKREATAAVEHVFDGIKKAVTDEEKFAYPGFGTFVVRHRAARDGRNPQTGKKIRIAASKTVAFRPASAFKSEL